ncbi:hypothetical protein BHQ19_10325 [Mycolicibacterium porcinum]|nr:hypothetical protein BHQ19_10325 [Mycolicibacterium porcinum]
MLTKVYIDGMAAKEKELEAMADGARAYIHRPLQAAVSQPLATIEQLVLEMVINKHAPFYRPEMQDWAHLAEYEMADKQRQSLKQLLGGKE